MDITSRNILRRGLGISLCVIMGVAVAGFFAGTREAITGGWDPPPRAPGASHAARPADSYLQMNGKIRGPNHGFRSELSRLVEPPVVAPVVNTPEDRARSLAIRATRRAYEGAPPVIPHPVSETEVGSCVSCHGAGRVIDGVVARPMSHQFLPNCTQCHSPVSNPDIGPLYPSDVVFTGLSSPGPGARAWPGAPPVIPHHTRMRENCMSCHGSHGWPGLRTTHPERVNCLQCHAGDAGQDGAGFLVAGDLGHPVLPSAPSTP